MSYTKPFGRQATVRLKLTDAFCEQLGAIVSLFEAGEIAEEVSKKLQRLKNSIYEKECTQEELECIISLRNQALADKRIESSLKKSLREPSEKLFSGLKMPTGQVYVESEAQVRRREWLMARQAAREYTENVQNLSKSNRKLRSSKLTIELRQVIRDILNGVAMVLICVGGFFAMKLLADVRGLDSKMGLIWGLFGAVSLLFVEVALYIIRATKTEKYERDKEKFMEKDRLFNVSGIPQPKKEE